MKKRFEERSKSKEKILHMIRNNPWSYYPKTQFLVYLSLSYINLNLAYATYFESPFGSNIDTRAKEFISWENKNQRLMPIFSKNLSKNFHSF